MGVDITGKKPLNKTGEYFRSNWWYWRPLVTLMEKASPELFGEVEYWGTNDGDGLKTQSDCDAMVKALDKMDYKEVIALQQALIDALPDEKCNLCQGTGKRKDFPDQKHCNKCHGKGKVRPMEANYPYDEGHTKEWMEFLSCCGGFEIW